LIALYTMVRHRDVLMLNRLHTGCTSVLVHGPKRAPAA
jgi:hypothetical protein